MSNLTIRFWGTRGSIPVPGDQTARYGGNTTCLEVRADDTIVIIDAGTGIRQLGNQLSKEHPDRLHTSLLFTHTHLDHIQGLPFFGPAYHASNRIDIYGESADLRRVLEVQMQSEYFPVQLSSAAATISFRQTPREFPLGPMRVRTMQLPHPGGCQGYRFETRDSTLVVATDCELNLLHNRQAQIRFFENADVIVIDCQYTDGQYPQRVGWGHNSISHVLDLCRRVRPATVVLTHHDPESDDQKIDRMVEEAGRRLRQMGVETEVQAARESAHVRVAPSARSALAS